MLARHRIAYTRALTPDCARGVGADLGGGPSASPWLESEPQLHAPRPHVVNLQGSTTKGELDEAQNLQHDSHSIETLTRRPAAPSSASRTLVARAAQTARAVRHAPRHAAGSSRGAAKQVWPPALQATRAALAARKRRPFPFDGSDQMPRADGRHVLQSDASLGASPPSRPAQAPRKRRPATARTRVAKERWGVTWICDAWMPTALAISLLTCVLKLGLPRARQPARQRHRRHGDTRTA
jgi:hypothetical protein